jgi:putative transposase
MVSHPDEYKWSSYHANALGIESSLRTPHGEYLSLGNTNEERLSCYRELFRTCLDPNSLNAIRNSVNKSLALGDDRFKSQIEENCKRRVTPMKMGRKRRESLL